MKQYVIKVNGISYQVEVEETAAGSFAPAAVQAVPAAAPAAASPAAAAPAAPPVIAPAPVLSSAAPAGSELVKAPMPGTILEVTVQLGESVTRGQVLCILEAMKMENEIVAPKEGTIASVSITKGSTVNAGDPLVSIA